MRNIVDVLSGGDDDQCDEMEGIQSGEPSKKKLSEKHTTVSYGLVVVPVENES
jgi:hypothetical protein